MKRQAFLLRLKPGGLAEYERHHREIWPELVAQIEQSGIARITIFENDPLVFMYSEILDEEAWNKLWHSEVHYRWAKVMSPLMHYRDDGIADATSLREIFNLETQGAESAS